VANRLIINGELVLYGDVGDLWGDGSGFSDREVLEALVELGPGDIVVRLNSGGGFVTDGWAIYNMLLAHPGNVTIYIDAMAASAASVIAMAGNKRIMREGSLMMIHDPSGVTWGTADDHIDTAELLNKMADICAAIYAKVSGKTEEECRQIMRDETWFDPAEAVAAGFADEIFSVAEGSAEEANDGEALNFAKFDYMQYKKPPVKAQSAAAQRPLPAKFKPAAAAARMEKFKMNEAEARAAADKLIAEATAEAARITAAAKDADAAAVAAAKVKADEIKADAQKAADKLIVDAKAAADKAAADASNVTADIYARCTTAKLTLAEANEIVAAAKGSLDTARDLIIDAVAKKSGDQSFVPAHVTADARDKFVEGATKGLLARAGHKDGERNEYSGMVLRELARETISMRGESTKFNDPMKLIGAAFKPTMYSGMHSTSDFVEILANVANKSMLKGFGEADETYDRWTAKGSLSDFRPAKRVDSGLFSNLSEIPEGSEYTYGTFGDRGESIVLATYGKMFSITRQAIINDDIGVFSTVPQKMGRASKRTIGNLVYGILTSNPLMSDGNALFSVAHGNLATPGGAPSLITVDAGRVAMAIQKDPDSIAAALNIKPRFFLVPPSLTGVAKTLMAAQYDPAATVGTLTPNTVAGLAEVIEDARLYAADTNAWFLLADPQSTDTIEVAYLNGNENPVMEQREGWNVDGVEFKIRLDAGVKALGWKGAYKNEGGS
jgi:ATP-dependent protease ClpP protease subunit